MREAPLAGCTPKMLTQRAVLMVVTVDGRLLCLVGCCLASGCVSSRSLSRVGLCLVPVFVSCRSLSRVGLCLVSVIEALSQVGEVGTVAGRTRLPPSKGGKVVTRRLSLSEVVDADRVDGGLTEKRETGWARSSPAPCPTLTYPTRGLVP